MQRAAAAKGKQREVAHILAAFDRDFLDRHRHLHIGETDDAIRHHACSVGALVAQRLRDALRQRVAREPFIERQCAVEKRLPADPTKNQIGVRHGWLVSATAERGGSGRRSGAARPDVELAGAVDRRDRAAPGPDFDNVEDRCLNRKSVFITADVIGAVDVEGISLDERALRRGAPHVEGDQLLVAELPGVSGSPDTATDGPGFDQRDRLLLGAHGREHAPVRAHEQKLAGEACLTHRAREAIDIAVGARAHIGVCGGGGAAFKFEPFPRQLRTGRDIDAGKSGPKQLRNQLLVRRIAIGVDERDGDCLDIEFPQADRECARPRLDQARSEHRRAHPFAP